MKKSSDFCSIFRKIVLKHKNKSILYISFIIFALDFTFVAINFFSSKETLDANLFQRAKIHQNEFNLTLQMTYRNMLQMSTFISLNEELNQIFLKGKRAIDQEGGGPGGEKAKQARQELLSKVKPSWDHMTKEFDIRQLHYQLGPGSLSFLRVHKPNKFGDRMDNLRYTIIDTNAENTARFGFETGRIYSGLRGVSPVWATIPETNEKIYVGALEVGTSFKKILPIFKRNFKADTAILLSKQHVENKMWDEFVNEYFDKNPDIDYYLESTTSKETKNILSQISIKENFVTDYVELVKKESQYFSVYYFPLRDYQGEKNKNLPPAGFVLMWEDISSLVDYFKRSFMVNIIYSIIGFIIVELCLIWFLNREDRLSSAEHHALTDGLTGLFNRRHFDNLLKIEINRAKRVKEPLSLIICDIDFFKIYNDTYGHQAGDECLKNVAKTLNAQIKRSSDFVARYGGEEFVIVLPYTSLESAVNIATVSRNAICSLNVEHINSQVEKFVTATFGVACTDNLAQNMDLFETADKNLYHAKKSGRNRVEPGKVNIPVASCRS